VKETGRLKNRRGKSYGMGEPIVDLIGSDGIMLFMGRGDRLPVSERREKKD